MKIRADIAELLHQGVPHVAIARQLHVSPTTVRTHAQPADNGHVRWTGCIDGGVPRACYRGQRVPALRIAFRLHHGRDPEGRLTRTCDMPGCVAGAHCVDRPMREERRRIAAANRRADRAFAAIFGEVA